MAGTEGLFEDQVGPCVLTTLPLMGWVEDLPGLVDPWVVDKVVVRRKRRWEEGMPHQGIRMRRVGSPTIKNGCPVGDTSLRFSACVVGGGISPRVVLVGASGTGPREEAVPLERHWWSTWWQVCGPIRVGQPLGG